MHNRKKNGTPLSGRLLVSIQLIAADINKLMSFLYVSWD
jgi:hypothetical protein